MPRDVLIPQGFLPKKSIRLGRFLVDPNEPQVSQHDPAIDIEEEKDVIISQNLDFSGNQQAGSGIGFGVGLPSLLSTAIENRFNSSTTVSTTRVTTYQLANSGSLFKKAVKNPATRLWIEEQHDDGWRNLLFVVGYYTMQDATVVLGADKGQAMQGQAQIPISATLASGGIILPVGGFTDPEISASCEKSESSQVRFVAPGERVCAFQYRKVVFRWFFSGNIDKATLCKDNRWHTVSPTLRRLNCNEDYEDEDDVLEVDLEDEDEDGGK